MAPKLARRPREQHRLTRARLQRAGLLAGRDRELGGVLRDERLHALEGGLRGGGGGDAGVDELHDGRGERGERGVLEDEAGVHGVHDGVERGVGRGAQGADDAVAQEGGAQTARGGLVAWMVRVWEARSPVEALFEEIALECGRVAAVNEGSVCEEPGLDLFESPLGGWCDTVGQRAVVNKVIPAHCVNIP